MRPFLAALAVCLAAPAAAQTGQVERVIDGDTIVIDGQTIRLWGIDAPELDDTCPGARFPNVGLAAQAAAIEWFGVPPLRCEIPPIGASKDEHGQLVRRCFLIDGSEVAATLVRGGYATDCKAYSEGFYADGVDPSLFSPDSIHQPECHVLTLCE